MALVRFQLPNPIEGHASVQTFDNEDAGSGKPAVNPAHAASMLAKALLASEQNADADLAAKAAFRVKQWQEILARLLTGAADYGSPTPLPETPAWATLEVITGGFATGRLLAGGPLEVYEKELIGRLAIPEDDEARLRLNAYYLTDQGMDELMAMLASNRYAIRYPEEGALFAVAWMCKAGFAEHSREALSTIAPFFRSLRFYPVPDFRAHRFDAGVFVQDIAATCEQLQRISPRAAILAQRRSVQQWAPLHDRVLALFSETMNADDWPCQSWPAGWTERASVLLATFDASSALSQVPSKYRKAGSHAAQLRGYLRQCIVPDAALSPRDLGRIRHIVRCSVTKRGHPLSQQNAQVRQRQYADVAAPLYAEIAQLVVQRLQQFDQHDGLDDPDICKAMVSDIEATVAVPAGTAIPPSVRRKIDRCRKDAIEELTRRGLISSSEMMATVLPQLTAGLHALGIEDPRLRQLYASIYRAFRQRRSLLLLNMESQVRLHELPWVSAIDRFRRADLSDAATSRQTLEQIVPLALEHFPHAILPNKLVHEIAALAKRAGLDIPLVEELATDIFVGAFSAKFTHAAKIAASMLQGSLYARYYQIDAGIGSVPDSDKKAASFWPWEKRDVQPDFAQLCAQRAGVPLARGGPATNGMIIEQQQIMTTQNLAVLIVALDLRGALRERFGDMAKACFRWTCSRNLIKFDNGHAERILIKNSAYAWRQMVFYLSMLPPAELASTLDWMDQHFARQSKQFQLRFKPVLDALQACVPTTSQPTAAAAPQRVFLGWSDTRHWLMRG